jgi:hypothetical protein
MLRDYGPDPTFSWNTGSPVALPGTHSFQVFAKALGSRKALEAHSSQNYILLSTNPCLDAGASLAPSNGHAAVGATVSITASSTNCTSPSYTYMAPTGRGLSLSTGLDVQPDDNLEHVAFPPGNLHVSDMGPSGRHHGSLRFVRIEEGLHLRAGC